jgi:hypothetical protein
MRGLDKPLSKQTGETLNGAIVVGVVFSNGSSIPYAWATQRTSVSEP